jgi:hypothetical protein
MSERKYGFEWTPDEGVKLNAPAEVQEEDDEPVLSGGKLKKKDLLEYENINKIRTYMVERKGVDYKDKEADTVVEDFVDHMRYFNTNLISTGGEVRFVSKADDRQKEIAKEAYQLYDDLGNVFVNDGFFGAVDGVKDYILAAASDPSNYVGLLTGGAGKAAAMGVTKGGKDLVKLAVKEAGERAVQQGLKGDALKKVTQEAAERTITRLAEKGVKGPTANRVISNVATKEKEAFLQGLRSSAEFGVKEGLQKAGQRKSLYATAAIDGTLSMLNDYQIQNVMIDVGAQEEYSTLQTSFSFGLGAVGAGAQLVGGKFKGSSGLAEAEGQLKRGEILQEAEAEIAGALAPKEIDRAAKTIKDAVDSWETKWQRGKSSYDNKVTPVDLVHDIMVGENGKGGLAKIFKDNNMKLGRNDTVSDVMTNIVRQLPEDRLKEINDRLQSTIGITLGDTTEAKLGLGDLLAKDISSSAQVLNIMSQTRKTIDAGLAHATTMIDEMSTGVLKEAQEAEMDKLKRAKPFQYGQSVWRRLLVSSPATTAVNVLGFAQFAAGQSLADMFSATSLMTASLYHGNSAKGKELRRMAGVYKSIQAQKMKNYLDPYTTHDAYMSFLEKNEDVSKVLFESYSGGVERSGKRFGFDENNKWFQGVEAVTESMNRLTGVKIQDTFTKSQMFMSEMDKNLRLSKGKTLQDVLADGTLEDIDEGVLSLTMETTLKSVYSKDYTTDSQLLGTTAKFVESISNQPVLGTILPFGRFMNNVVATTYQWSPLSTATSAARIAKSQYDNTGTKISDIEAFSRSLVGTSALGMAVVYDSERQDKNLGVYDLDVGGGTIIDAKNTFPLSLWLVAGRVGNLIRQDQTVPKELMVELGSQLAVGQLARDAQFGNDLNNVMDTMLNFEEGKRQLAFEGLYKVSGNFTAGFTRPLDAVNKLTGYITGTDTAKDLRQAEGGAVFTQSATKYFDNIIEAFTGEIDGLTGEQLEVGSRKGEIYDANPLARIFGITVKRGRNSTEKAYSMANMAEWTASERSKMPEYDKVFNSHLAPILEKATDILIRDKRYVEGDSDTRKEMLRDVLSQTKAKIRKYLREDSPGSTQITAIRSKASEHGSKENRTRAKKAMKNRFNIDAPVSEMNFRELKFFMDYVDYLDQTVDTGYITD